MIVIEAGIATDIEIGEYIKTEDMIIDEMIGNVNETENENGIDIGVMIEEMIDLMIEKTIEEETLTGIMVGKQIEDVD